MTSARPTGAGPGISPQKLAEVERMAQLSPWAWDVTTDLVWCPPELFAVHGLTADPAAAADGGLVALPMALWLSTLADDDGAAATAFAQRIIDTGEGGRIEYEVHRPEGSRWLTIYAIAAEHGDDGAVRRAFGYTQDITDQKRLEVRYQQIDLERARDEDLLQGIVDRVTLDETLDHVCTSIEELFSGTRCAVWLLDVALIDAEVRVLIDDFGTGFSSLSRLRDLAFSGLKIDREFVGGLAHDSAARSMVRAMVDIAHAHGAIAVAEGVEDAETLGIVEALGCDYAQGFYLGRPMPADAVEAVLASPPPVG